MLYGLVRTCVIITVHPRNLVDLRGAGESRDPTRTIAKQFGRSPADSMYQIVPGVGRGQSRFK